MFAEVVRLLRIFTTMSVSTATADARSLHVDD